MSSILVMVGIFSCNFGGRDIGSKRSFGAIGGCIFDGHIERVILQNLRLSRQTKDEGWNCYGEFTGQSFMQSFLTRPTSPSVSLGIRYPLLRVPYL